MSNVPRKPQTEMPQMVTIILRPQPQIPKAASLDTSGNYDVISGPLKIRIPDQNLAWIRNPRPRLILGLHLSCTRKPRPRLFQLGLQKGPVFLASTNLSLVRTLPVAIPFSSAWDTQVSKLKPMVIVAIIASLKCIA